MINKIESRQSLLLITILVLVTVVITLLSSAILYQAALEEEKERLVEMAQSRARMIESIANFHEQRVHNAVPENAFETTLAQVREAHANFKAASRTGEFVLARRTASRIEFLLRQHHSIDLPPGSIDIDSNNAEPMRRALQGESGTIIGPDYNGDIVLAAYEPLSVYGLGVVAKIDMDEMREPFIKAVLSSSAIAIVLIITGSIAFRRIVSPMISKLQQSEIQLREAQRIGKIGNIEWNLQTNEWRCSDEIYRIFGIEPGSEGLPFDRYDSFIHPDDRTDVMGTIDHHIHLNEPFSMDYRIGMPDGAVKWVHEISHLTFDRNGSPLLRYSTLQDIDRRKNTEIDLNRTNEELKKALGKIKTISGIMPLCAWCHEQVRTDDKGWVRLENYIEGNTNAQITHSICPSCQEKLLTDSGRLVIPPED